MEIEKLEVKIELTKRCYLSCKHCSSRAGRGTNIEIAQKYIDRILLDSSIIERVVLTGGEPLSCSHLLETLKKFNNVGFLPSVYTSGVFDKNSISLDLLVGKISRVIVSLHGPELIHDRITNYPGSFMLTTRFLENVKIYQIPIGIHIIALRENIETIPDLIYWLKDRGFYDLSVLRYVPQGRGSDIRIIPPSKDMLYLLYQKLSKDGVRFGAPFNFIRNNKVMCKVAYKTLTIDVFGNVMPCDSFKDIANHDAEYNLLNSSLLRIIKESSQFIFARKNSMMLCDSECCLGQYLLEIQKNSHSMVASYA